MVTTSLYCSSKGVRQTEEKGMEATPVCWNQDALEKAVQDHRIGAEKKTEERMKGAEGKEGP